MLAHSFKMFSVENSTGQRNSRKKGKCKVLLRSTGLQRQEERKGPGVTPDVSLCRARITFTREAQCHPGISLLPEHEDLVPKLHTFLNQVEKQHHLGGVLQDSSLVVIQKVLGLQERNEAAWSRPMARSLEIKCSPSKTAAHEQPLPFPHSPALSPHGLHTIPSQQCFMTTEDVRNSPTRM